jgi:hypothetical protein
MISVAAKPMIPITAKASSAHARSKTTRIAVAEPRADRGFLILHIHLAIKIEISMDPTMHERTVKARL